MKKFTHLLLLFMFTLPAMGSSGYEQKKQFPNFGIIQYFAPTKDLTHSINKPLIYLNQDFLPGSIVTQDNQIIKPGGLRYNITEDVIECLINEQYGRISSPKKLHKVEIDGISYVYKHFPYKDNYMSGYLQKIHSGAKNIYVKYIFKQAKNYSDDWFKKIFYVEDEESGLKKVNSLRSEINRIFRGKENLANAYMKENNYNWKNANDLIQLFNYMDKLNADNVASR
ncbi:hypothetical protein [Marinifilum sp.]|uniref:hypothetical protein n=1 Tax=Marinifilum sp. TaxID=2033137 RepID=UPI003BAB8244